MSEDNIPVIDLFASALREGTISLYEHYIEEHCKTEAEKEILTSFVLVLIESLTGTKYYEENLGR